LQSDCKSVAKIVIYFHKSLFFSTNQQVFFTFFLSLDASDEINIKEDSAVIGNFSKDDIKNLFAQRTADTGQQITPEAIETQTVG